MHGVQQFGAGQLVRHAHSQSGGLIESGVRGVQQFEAGQFMQQAHGQRSSVLESSVHGVQQHGAGQFMRQAQRAQGCNDSGSSSREGQRPGAQYLFGADESDED
eukprot:11579114-Alexandrium_andersonii.AAC.1